MRTQKIAVQFAQPPVKFTPAILKEPVSAHGKSLDQHVTACLVCRLKPGLLCPESFGLMQMTIEAVMSS